MKNQTGVVLTAFGVASATMYVSPSAEAGIIDLTPNPNPAGFGVCVIVSATAGTLNADFEQCNDSNGKSLYGLVDGIQGFRPAIFSSTINTTQTFGIIGVAPNATGSAVFGFITSSNNLGWLEITDWGGAGGAITYGGMAINDVAGECIHVSATTAGGNDCLAPPPGPGIPEPETLGLLALGLLAAGASRKRRKANRDDKAA